MVISVSVALTIPAYALSPDKILRSNDSPFVGIAGIGVCWERGGDLRRAHHQWFTGRVGGFPADSGFFRGTNTVYNSLNSLYCVALQESYSCVFLAFSGAGGFPVAVVGGNEG